MKIQDWNNSLFFDAQGEWLDHASQASKRQTDLTSLANPGQLTVADWSPYWEEFWKKLQEKEHYN